MLTAAARTGGDLRGYTSAAITVVSDRIAYTSRVDYAPDGDPIHALYRSKLEPVADVLQRPLHPVLQSWNDAWGEIGRAFASGDHERTMERIDDLAGTVPDVYRPAFDESWASAALLCGRTEDAIVRLRQLPSAWMELVRRRTAVRDEASDVVDRAFTGSPPWSRPLDRLTTAAVPKPRTIKGIPWTML
jgi:hypothetical protein